MPSISPTGCRTPPPLFPSPPLLFRNADVGRCRVFFTLRSGRDVRERRWCWWRCGEWVDTSEGIRGETRNNRYVSFLPLRSKPAQGQRLLSPYYLKEDVFTNRLLTVQRRVTARSCLCMFVHVFFQAADAHCPGASFICGKHRHSVVGGSGHAARCKLPRSVWVSFAYCRKKIFSRQPSGWIKTQR